MDVTRTAIKLWFYCVFACSCSVEISTPMGPELAKVGSKSLYLEQAKAQIPKALFQSDSASVLRSYVEQWIRTQLVAQEADRRNLAQRPQNAWEVEHAKDEALAFIMRREQLKEIDEQTISEDEILRFYEENKEQFISDEKKVRTLLIKTSDLNSALEAKKLLTNDTNWLEIVQEFALQKELTQQRAQEYVVFSGALLDQPIMRQYLLEGMAQKEVSAIRRVGDEFHFIQLLEAIEAGQAAPLSEVRDVIKSFLRAENRRKKLQAFERQLHLRAEANNEMSSIFDN